MKRNGFTLIELLAVIAILAIIAIITTPTILNVINDSRKSAAEDKAWGTIDAVKMAYAQAQTKGYSEATDSERGITYDGTNKTLTVDFIKSDLAFDSTPITMSGDRPTSGKVIIDLSTGQVTAEDLFFEKNGDYICKTISSSTMNCEVHTGPIYVYAFNVYASNNIYYTGANQSTLKSLGTVYGTLQALATANSKDFGLKYGIENGKIIEAYACGIFSGEEICLKGSTDGSTFAANKQILNEKLNCDCTSTDCTCSGGGLGALVRSNGTVNVGVSISSYCFVRYDGLAAYYGHL